MTQIVSSISGIEIYAPSAGYAPLNSASVSSIASGYQVVSATATQLYAGTAHVTSINSTPISASRAGNAANASMANSAYYDGTGRLISSLPDSATVSSIASSYAPTFGLNAGKISSINGSALDTPTGSQVVTATGSGWFGGGGIGITSINGSALFAQEAYLASRATYDDLGASFRYDYAKQSAFSGVSATVANNSASWGQGGAVSSPSGTIFVSGDKIEGTNSAVLTASSEEGFTTSFAAIGGQIPSWTSQELYAGTLPGSGATLYIPTNVNLGNTATAIISGKDSNMAIVTASGLASEYPIAIYLGAIVNTISASANTYIPINGDLTAEKTGGITVTGIGELAWASSVSGVVNTVSSNSATWGQGGVDSATVSSIASSYAESAISSVSGDYYSTSNPAGYITGVDLSNYATTGYVDSSVSGKLDSTAFNSGDFYSNANPSGFITGVDLSPYQTTADMSGYIPTSLSSDFQQVTGMSSYVPYSSIGYNTASAISGINGSALAGTTYSAGTGIDITDDVISVETPVDIVAGPGIVIDNPDGNTLRVSTDENYETVLWSNDSGSSSIALSEPMTNFEMCRFKMKSDQGNHYDFASKRVGNVIVLFFTHGDANAWSTWLVLDYDTSTDTITVRHSKSLGHSFTSNSTTLSGAVDSYKDAIVEVVGIHRISGGN